MECDAKTPSLVWTYLVKHIILQNLTSQSTYLSGGLENFFLPLSNEARELFSWIKMKLEV